MYIDIHFERAMEAKNAMIARSNQYELQKVFIDRKENVKGLKRS